ncbi:hypothetical protein QQF64_007222 [Cirrhinus molitorella]|uniref:Uncharacterized protein n=1 Tax=Cirrhinus molitorella TaxID=172907 RepID=A0ABR3MDE2_9TELE
MLPSCFRLNVCMMMMMRVRSPPSPSPPHTHSAVHAGKEGTDTAGWSVAIKRQKKREHTEAGGALALDCRESGQLAVQQEVRRLIRLREPPLGQRSQRSVGTWLDPLCALGTLEDRAHQAAVDLSSVATVCQGVVLTSQCSTNPKDDTLGQYEAEIFCFEFCCSCSHVDESAKCEVHCMWNVIGACCHII